ncbi:hypothetical protein B0H10DRAFT_877768 [Mycena sp. CBHHK59/15]|nr:hypothetical protein B0H10DRAFT_877768 [Mycena sp. CBHHK59/15]
MKMKPVKVSHSTQARLVGHPHWDTVAFKQDVQNLIEKSEDTITRLELQIQDLATVDLRDQEHDIIATLRDAIAPVRKLPVELMAEIFLFAVYVRTTKRDSATQLVKAVLRLSQVCTYWRHLAHSTPRLWAGCRKFELHPRASRDPYLSLTKAWLERSAPLPNPIHLSIRIHLSGRDGASTAPLTDVLLGIANRWRALHWHTYTLAPLVQLSAGTLQNLETLYLDGGLIIGPQPKVTAFLTAPRLRKATLHKIGNMELISMPWSQLTDISLNHESPKACLDVLLQYPSLSGRSETTTVLTQLKTLELGFIPLGQGRSYFMPFFQHLNAPALQALVMQLDSDLVWSTTEFTLFQLRSPRIQRLTINYSSLGSEHLRAALKHARSLTHLRLFRCDRCVDNSLLDALRYSDLQTEPLAPNLRSLRWHSVSDAFEEELLEAMIRSRWWTDQQLRALSPSRAPAVARWKCVDVSKGVPGSRARKYSKKFLIGIRELRAEGLDVEIDGDKPWLCDI